MKGLGKRQKRVLELIIEDVRTHGVAPTQGRVADLSGIAAPWKVLQGLVSKGYLHHPYQGAPWAPVRDLDGEPLRLGMAEREVCPQPKRADGGALVCLLLPCGVDPRLGVILDEMMAEPVEGVEP